MNATVWANGRESFDTSTAYAEVIVPIINVRDAPGGKYAVGTLPHGARCTLLESRHVPEEQRDYHHIGAPHVRGWLPAQFVATNWSTFTFLARVREAPNCRNLDTRCDYRGMELIAIQNNVAVTTEGDPAQFEGIRTAALSFANRLFAAQTPISATALTVEFMHWVENPAEGSDSKHTVGFVALLPESATAVTNAHISLAATAVPRMALVPYLDLALNDFALALRYPDHALIFLARAIESVEYYFDRGSPKPSKQGRESLMRKELEVPRADVEYVTKRANESHRRHADPSGKLVPIAADELAKCFKNTGVILAKFVDHIPLSP